MKTLINIVIVTMFGIEICSPFFLGYLNQKEKVRKIYTEKETQTIASDIKDRTQIKEIKWEEIDFTGNNYAESKTYTVKE
jgi:hypothetical protein